MTALIPLKGEIVDIDAAKIGDLYRKSKSSMVESVRCLLEAGHRLAARKASLGHGAWLQWLEKNAEVLGFGERTARMLIRGANRKPASDLSEDNALAINREIWGHVSPRTIGTGEVEWYTPPQYIELARTVFGEIDLDPASSDKAQETVRARQHFTVEQDGLRREWHGRVWLNPPYAFPVMGEFVEKLVEERAAERFTAAIMLTHSYTDTAWFHTASEIADAICFPRGRIAFLDV